MTERESRIDWLIFTIVGGVLSLGLILKVGEYKEIYKDYKYERQKASHVTTQDGVRYYLYRDENKAVVVPLKRRYDIGSGGIYVTSKFYKGHIAVKDTVTYLFHKYPVTEVGKEAFEGCEELESVQLPNTIKKIGEKAFKNCKKLQTINWPDSLILIKRSAFSHCNSLREVELYGDCRILEYAFFECDALERFIYKRERVVKPNPETDPHVLLHLEKSIAGAAFYGCKNLSYVEIDALNATFYTFPSDIIGGGFEPIFGYDKALKEIHISPECRNIFFHEGSVYDKNTLDLLFCLPTVDSIYYVPEGANRILPHAFHGVPLKEIWLPTTITSICYDAFTDSTIVHLPQYTKIKIDDEAFNGEQTIEYYIKRPD